MGRRGCIAAENDCFVIDEAMSLYIPKLQITIAYTFIIVSKMLDRNNKCGITTPAILLVQLKLKYGSINEHGTETNVEHTTN